MENKKSQITVFIILLFVIGIAFSFVVLVGKETAKSESSTSVKKTLSVDDADVRNFVESCVSVTAKQALFYLGFVGGRLEPDAFVTYFSIDEKYKIPYFYVEGNNNIPVPYEEEYWENLLDQYIELNFESCISNFSSFKGYTIEYGESISNTEFTDREVVFNVDFPVTIIRDFQEVNLDPRYIDGINVRLRDILNFITTIVEKEVKNDKYIHWDYLTKISDIDYDITAYTEDDNTIIYRIIDLENKIDDEPYVFQFANKIEPIENILPGAAAGGVPILISKTADLYAKRQIKDSEKSGKRTPQEIALENINSALGAGLGPVSYDQADDLNSSFM